MAIEWKQIAFVEDVAAQSVLGNPTGSPAVASAITVAEQTLVGRITGGNVDDLSVAQVKTLLGVISDTAYAASWDGVTDVAPSKNAVYDKVELLAPKLSPVFTASAASEATLGDNLVTNGDFATNDLTGWTAAAGWSAATGKAVHTAGISDTTPLVQAISLTNGKLYMVEVTTSGLTAGSVTLTFGSLGGSTSITFNTITKYCFLATSTTSFNLTITPTDTFNGAVDDIVVKEVLVNTTPIMDIEDSVPTSLIPIRGSVALANIGIGYGSLQFNVYGNYNTAIGYESLLVNATGIYNVGIGCSALYSNINGNYNIAVGTQSLYNNITGINNSGIGYRSLYKTTTGSYNTGLGSTSLYNNTTGSYNIGIGRSSLYSITTGSYNIGIGYYAGRYYGTGTGVNATSSYSIYIGSQTRASADGAQNECVIGYNNPGNGSNTITLGNASVTGWYMGTTKLIGVRGAAVADATGAGDVVAQLNALLARIRAHGLIAT